MDEHLQAVVGHDLWAKAEGYRKLIELFCVCKAI